MSFPVGDWQFWIASAIAASAAWAIIRPLLPSGKKAQSCPGCPSGQSRTDAAARKATLTIGGVRPK